MKMVTSTKIQRAARPCFVYPFHSAHTTPSKMHPKMVPLVSSKQIDLQASPHHSLRRIYRSKMRLWRFICKDVAGHNSGSNEILASTTNCVTGHSEHPSPVCKDIPDRLAPFHMASAPWKPPPRSTSPPCLWLSPGGGACGKNLGLVSILTPEHHSQTRRLQLHKVPRKLRDATRRLFRLSVQFSSVARCQRREISIAGMATAESGLIPKARGWSRTMQMNPRQ